MHPIARDDPWFWVADTLLHAMVEQDPNLTVRKFLRHSLDPHSSQNLLSRGIFAPQLRQNLLGAKDARASDWLDAAWATVLIAGFGGSAFL